MNANTSSRFTPYPSPSSSSSSSFTTPAPSSSSSAPSSLTPAQRHQMLTAMLASEYRPRQWEPVGPQGQEVFSVVSYNILSNTLAQIDPKFQGTVYDADLLDWTARRTRLLNEIAFYDADVVCVQELDEGDFDGAFGKEITALGYDKVFKKRNAKVEHGCAIFYRAKLIKDCHIPFPRGVVEGVDNPGVMLVLELPVGKKLQRVCVATTHIPCKDCQGGLKRVGQVMALLSAAADLLKKNSEMVFIFTGDFNVIRNDMLAKYVVSGSLNLEKMWRRSKKTPSSTVKGFKSQTQALRGVLTPSSSVSEADKPKAVKPSEVKKPSEADKLRLMIKSGRDLMHTTVSHPIYTASVYRLNAIVDFIFHGAIVGGRQLEVVSRLELPERLAQLKAGLPAGHLGSDHFALGAKFRVTDRVVGLGWSGTSDYIHLPADGQPAVEVDVRNKKRYFL